MAATSYGSRCLPKKETAALIYLKTAACLCFQLFGRKRPSATTAVFLFPQGSTPLYYL